MGFERRSNVLSLGRHGSSNCIAAVSDSLQNCSSAVLSAGEYLTSSISWAQLTGKCDRLIEVSFRFEIIKVWMSYGNDFERPVWARFRHSRWSERLSNLISFGAQVSSKNGLSDKSIVVNWWLDLSKTRARGTKLIRFRAQSCKSRLCGTKFLSRCSSMLELNVWLVLSFFFRISFKYFWYTLCTAADLCDSSVYKCSTIFEFSNML